MFESFSFVDMCAVCGDMCIDMCDRSPVFESFTWSNIAVFSSDLIVRLANAGLPHPIGLFNTNPQLFVAPTAATDGPHDAADDV